MGLREKALRFKQEAQLQDTPLDTIPGPAETPPATGPNQQESSAEGDSSASAVDSESGRDIFLQKGANAVSNKATVEDEKEGSLLEMAYEILSTHEFPLAYDVIFLAIVLALHERKAAMWLVKDDHLELVASRSIDEDEISYLALPDSLTDVQVAEVVSLQPWDDSWSKVAGQVDALLPLGHEGRLQGVVAVGNKPEVTAQIRGLLQIIGYTLHQHKVNEGLSGSSLSQAAEKSTQNDFFQWVESFINERMARDNALAAVPLTLQNLKRLQALLGSKRASQAIQMTKELIWGELSSDDRFFRIGYNRFLLLFHEGKRVDTRMNKIFSDLRSWQAGPDFRLLPSYEILWPQRDFANAGELLSLL